MANPNAPFGFKPIKSLSGGEVTVNYYQVASSASRIGKGDLVQLASTGVITRVSTTAATGPFLGVSMVDSGTLAAGGITKHPVCDDPSAIFEAQCSSGTLAVTNFNQNYAVQCGTAVTAGTGLSNDRIALATTLTNSTGVRILRAVDRPDIVATGTGSEYSVVECHILSHSMDGAESGI